jgi:hypothetical protein
MEMQNTQSPDFFALLLKEFYNLPKADVKFREETKVQIDRLRGWSSGFRAAHPQSQSLYYKIRDRNKAHRAAGGCLPQE